MIFEKLKVNFSVFDILFRLDGATVSRILAKSASRPFLTMIFQKDSSFERVGLKWKTQ